MWLHLADTSNERGQYGLIAELGYRSTLMSFAYPKAEDHFSKAWRGVRLHLAGAAPAFPDVYTKVRDRLDTYAYPRDVAQYQEYKPPGARLIIDSGAFTAYTLGKRYTVKDYAAWAFEFRKRWESELAFLRFMNLDVVGDQEATWVNHDALERLGLNPIAIVTYGAERKHLERAMESDYIALGGLVPLARQKAKLHAWLGYCFGLFVARYRETGIMPKVHLLGVGQRSVIMPYPAYSADTSSWLKVMRFGAGAAGGIKLTPKINDNRHANLHVLRAEILKCARIADDATKLWEGRGITWTD